MQYYRRSKTDRHHYGDASLRHSRIRTQSGLSSLQPPAYRCEEFPAQVALASTLGLSFAPQGKDIVRSLISLSARSLCSYDLSLRAGYRCQNLSWGTAQSRQLAYPVDHKGELSQHKPQNHAKAVGLIHSDQTHY